MGISLTELRANLYKLVDSVIASGEPLEVDRNGRTVLISPAPPPAKLDALVKRPNVITGDPDDLVSIDWSGEWNSA